MSDMIYVGVQIGRLGLAEGIEVALAKHQARMGCAATVVLVNAGRLAEDPVSVEGVRVIGRVDVLPRDVLAGRDLP